MKSIGEIIKSYRLERGMTQEQLGSTLYVTKQAVSKWENDTAMPDLETIRRISEVLSIPGDVILQRAIKDPRANSEQYQILRENHQRLQKETQIEAWRDYKFGMFIHYGLYSVIGRINEWVMFHEPIDKDDYRETMKEFSAENFDANYYADLAKRTGMKYMVFTTRHHDGFALYDSPSSSENFTVMHTPAARDLVKEYTNACRNAGLGVGLYYSPMDWRFEGYFFPQMYRKSAYAMRNQCYAQVMELMENYGKIDVLWYDGGEDTHLAHGINLNKYDPSREREDNYKDHPPIPEFWGEYELDEIVRTRQPHIVINNRLGMRRCGDYTTPERKIGAFDLTQPWETCDTLSETWGWTPGCKVLSKERILHMLIDVVTGGGNLLLNVAPKGDGSLEKEHEERLLEVGEWLSRYGDTIYGTRGGPFKNEHTVGGFTHRDNKIVAFIKKNARGAFRIPLCGGAVRSVTARTGETLESVVENDVLSVRILGERDEIASVIEVMMEQNVDDLYVQFDPNSFDAFA